MIPNRSTSWDDVTWHGNYITHSVNIDMSHQYYFFPGTFESEIKSQSLCRNTPPPPIVWIIKINKPVCTGAALQSCHLKILHSVSVCIKLHNFYMYLVLFTTIHMVLTLQGFTMPFNGRRTQVKKVWYLERKHILENYDYIF